MTPHRTLICAAAIFFLYSASQTCSHMYSLTQPGVASDVISRMAQLSPDAKAQWGKMNVSQMLAHCQAPLLVALGEKQMKSNLTGKLFGGMIKKKMLRDAPFK